MGADALLSDPEDAQEHDCAKKIFFRVLKSFVGEIRTSHRAALGYSLFVGITRESNQ